MKKKYDQPDDLSDEGGVHVVDLAGLPEVWDLDQLIDEGELGLGDEGTGPHLQRGHLRLFRARVVHAFYHINGLSSNIA